MNGSSTEASPGQPQESVVASIRQSLLDADTRWTLTGDTQCREHLGGSGTKSDPLSSAYTVTFPLGSKLGADILKNLPNAIITELGFQPAQVRVKFVVGQGIRLEFDPDAFEEKIHHAEGFAAQIVDESGAAKQPASETARAPEPSNGVQRQVRAIRALYDSDIYKHYILGRLFRKEGKWVCDELDPEKQPGVPLAYVRSLQLPDAEASKRLVETMEEISKILDIHIWYHGPHTLAVTPEDFAKLEPVLAAFKAEPLKSVTTRQH